MGAESAGGGGMGFGDIAGAVAPIVGQGLGLLFGKQQDARQIRQQQKLTDMQIAGNKQMADYQQQLQMKMWNDTNAEAQMKHLKMAGLNPALMYKGSGAGGQLSGGTSGVGMAQAANAATTMQADNGMAMMMAQIANTLADTAKTNAETENIPKTGENIDADTALKTAQTSGVEQSIKESESKIEEINAKVANIENSTEISERSKEYQIKIAQEEAVTGVLRNILMAEQKDNIKSSTEKNRSDIQVNNAKLNEISNNILQGWEGLKQQDSRIAIEKFRAEVESNYKGISQVAGGSLDRLIERLFELGNKNRGWRKIEGN